MDIRKLNERLEEILEEQTGISFLRDFCKNDGKILGIKQLADKLFNLFYSEGIDGLKNHILPYTKAFYEYIDFTEMARDLCKVLKDEETDLETK